MSEAIHFVGDGRGRRRVLVNGNPVKWVVFADISRGVVRYVPKPFRLHKTKRDEVYTRTLRGVVEVVFIKEDV